MAKVEQLSFLNPPSPKEAVGSARAIAETQQKLAKEGLTGKEVAVQFSALAHLLQEKIKKMLDHDWDPREFKLLVDATKEVVGIQTAAFKLAGGEFSPEAIGPGDDVFEPLSQEDLASMSEEELRAFAIHERRRLEDELMRKHPRLKYEEVKMLDVELIYSQLELDS